MRRDAARLLAGLLALASVAPLGFGAFLTFFNVGYALERPDPSIPDGDPCCGHPDSWSEVALGAGWAVVILAGVVGVAYLAWRLAHFALSGSRPTSRQLQRAWVATCLLLIVVGVLVVPEALTDSINGLPG